MSTVGPLKATFFAFRKREKGGVLLMATLTYLAISAALGGVFYALNWRLFGPVFSWYGDFVRSAEEAASYGDKPEFPEPPAELLSLLPGYFVFFVAAIILVAAYEAACLRWLTRGTTGGLFGITFGADTWRVWFTYWSWLFSFIALVVCFVIAGALFGLLSSLAVNALGAGAEIVVGIGVFATVIFAYGFLITFVVRMAPAAAMSVAAGEFSFLKTWRATKGRFWALFGSFLLLWLIFAIPIAIVEYGALSLASGVPLGEFFTPKEHPGALIDATIQAFSTPRSIGIVAAAGVVIVMLSFLFRIGMYGVNARAAVAALEEGSITPHNWGKPTE